ncbi:aminopeptidase P family protein [Ectothiorhodospiraceae bacterium BW-2]|nr:aminopeptidase P family protein [Ectothiorhodospiraceae bacterium BW-2]
MLERDDLVFPFEEYKRRLDELRARMEQRLLEVVIVSDPENLYYLTGHKTTGYSFFQALVVPLEGEPFMVIRRLEASNVYERTWVEIVRPFADTEDAIQMLVASMKEMGLANKRIGFERNSYFLPAYQQDSLQYSLTSGQLNDCFGIVEEGRIIKSKFEIEIMRQAAKATEAGMKAGIAATCAGVTENDIAADIASAMFKAGGEPPAVMPYVTSGPRTMIGHATWEGRKVLPGEHVFLEVGGCYRQYHTAMMRTVILGELDDKMAYAQERSQKALIKAKELIRPGISVSDLDNLVRQTITVDDDHGILITRSGYSIGIAFPPSWDEGYILSLAHGNPTVLREGMTFHLIPWVWGVEGKKTCGISDTLRVTADGCESFFSMTEEFTIKSDQGPKAAPVKGEIAVEAASNLEAKASKPPKK